LGIETLNGTNHSWDSEFAPEKSIVVCDTCERSRKSLNLPDRSAEEEPEVDEEDDEEGDQEIPESLPVEKPVPTTEVQTDFTLWYRLLVALLYILINFTILMI